MFSRRLLVALLTVTLAGPCFAAQSAPSSQKAPAAKMDTKTLEGEWQGELTAGGQKLPLVLKVSKAGDGKFSATLDSPTQGAKDIPVSAIEQTADEVKFELSSLPAAYQGKMNAAGSEIQGEWKQGGASMPLTFKRSEKKEAEKEPKGLPATLAGFQDEGTFLLIVGEERLGEMQSTWKTDGSVESHATISLAGQTIHATTKITPDAEGRWAQITVESAVGTMIVTRDSIAAKRTFKDKTTTWETREGVLLFDKNTPNLASQAVGA